MPDLFPTKDDVRQLEGEFIRGHVLREMTGMFNRIEWSYKLLRSLEAIAPIKSFSYDQNQSWSVEFYDHSSHIDPALELEDLIPAEQGG